LAIREPRARTTKTKWKWVHQVFKSYRFSRCETK